MRGPPPGPDLAHDRFMVLVVNRVRADIPTLVARRRGRRIVLRNGEREVTIDGWVVWTDRVYLSIGERRDRFVAENVARSIVAALSGPA